MFTVQAPSLSFLYYHFLMSKNCLELTNIVRFCITVRGVTVYVLYSAHTRIFVMIFKWFVFGQICKIEQHLLTLRQFWTWRSENWGFVMKYKSIAYVMMILNIFLIFFSCTHFGVMYQVPQKCPFSKKLILSYVFTTSKPIKLTQLVVKHGYISYVFLKVICCPLCIFAQRISSEFSQK